MNHAMGTQTLSGAAITLLERILDIRAERQTLIATNIANAEMPRDQATDIDFEGTQHSAAPLIKPVITCKRFG